MLYFLGQFGDQVSALNVFRYITFRTAGATMTAIVFVFLFGPAIIAALRVRQGKGQPIREDGPQNHLITKKGTPTMGGLMILSGIVVTTLLWANLASPYVWVVLFVTIGFGCIGLYDDYLKVSKASANNGFSGRLRLSLEAAIAIVACIALAYIGSPQLSTALTFPFLKEAVINLGWFFVPVGAFVIVGAGNAVNLTDGLDGLAIVPVMIAAASFALIAYLSGNIVFAEYLQIHYVPGTGELAIICGAVLGAGLGFLWFNAPPAAIFMGDTGSLALGGLLGAVAVASKHEVVLAIVGGLFVLEAMSVIIQVTSFKLTGKRIFKMAPIHHHFEALGWTEAQVVIRFWIVAVLLALVGLSSLKIKMIPVTTFAGRSVAVFGLGGSGIASALALAEGGAEVSAWDDNAESVATARAAGVSVADLRIADWQSFAALVLSPGVPLTHPKPAWPVVSARAAGIEIIGDIELFCRERRAHVPDAPFVAVTGTNGKSTTTALIAHLLSVTGREVELGGNIGKAILSLEPPRTGRYHVIECSSFQIDLAPTINPTVGVLLNVTPDHLDRHGTLPAYARIKERLVAGSDTAVIAVDDGWTQSIADRIQRHGTRVIRVSSRHPVADGIYASGSDIIAVDAAASHVIDRLAGINTLRGEHNAQNAAAAIAAVRTLGLNDAEIQRGLQLFAGLPHRLEEVGRRGNVTFINDSKATNADATSKALAALSRIYWIAGGRQKEGGIAGLAPFFPRIMKAYLIGEAANEFSATLGDDVPYMMCGTLQAAVAAAASDAADDAAHDPVVLLSPACASYDQFQNFERRGDAFRALVLQLNGITAQGEAA